MNILKQSTAATIKLGPFVDDTDGKTAETALTIGQADIRLSKNGGDIAQTNNATGATHDELGYYDIPLDTTDTGTLGRLRVLVSKAGALPVWQDFLIVTANVFDTFCSTGSLNVNAASLSTDAITAASVKADAVTKIQNGLATPTNITAGTITTVTNLTNLPNGTGANQISLSGGKVLLQATQTGVTIPTVTAVGTTTNLTNLPTMPTDWLTAAGLKADAVTEIQSGLATASALDAVDNFIDTEVAAILAAVDTEVAAIKAKTDNLPASPAAVGSAMTLTAAYDKAKDDVLTPLAVVDSIVDGLKTTLDNIHDTDLPAVKTETAAIKAKTDNLPATPASAGEYTAAIAAIPTAPLLAANYTAPDNASIAAILADTGTDGVVLASTQGAITWAQQKIVANVATQGALDISNSNPNGYGVKNYGGWSGVKNEGLTQYGVINTGGTKNVFGHDPALALESTLTAIKGAGWTDETLVKIVTDIAAISAGSGATAQEVWEYATRVLTAGTNIDLSSLATATDLATVDTVVDAIKAKTDNLPATPAVADEYDAALAAIQADLDNPNQYKADVSALMLASSYVAPNNAGITAIKAKTDNLPANTATALAAIQSDLDNPAQYKADVSGLATTAHVQEVENKIDAIDVTVNTIPTNPLLDTAYTAPDNAGIAAIQEKTEQLTFTAPNKVDANADVALSPEAIEGMATAIRDGLPEDIWSSSIRTLTQSPAEIIATVLGADITQIRGDSWAVQLTGVELGSIQQLAIKHSAKQPDSAALLFVDSVNGLTVLNRVAQDGEDSSKASLTYDGTILTLTVDASITAQLPAGSFQYGIQSISYNGIVSEPYGGTFRVLADIVRATD